MDRLEAMEIFVRVVDTESFTAVAQEMGMTQPTISKRVAALEQLLGAKLLHRSTRQLSLTDEGRLLYASAQAILGNYEATVERLRSSREAPQGRLRVSMPTTFGLSRVIPELPAFREAYPHIELDLVMDDGYTDLVEEAIDLAIRIGQLAESSMIATVLGHSPRVLVAAPGVVAPGDLQHPCQLADLPCMTYTNIRLSDRLRFSGPQGEVTVRVRGPVRANNAEALRHMARCGMGLALLPLWLVIDDLERGLLERHLEAFQPRCFTIYGLRPPTDYLPMKVRVAVDFIRERFRDKPWSEPHA